MPMTETVKERIEEITKVGYEAEYTKSLLNELPEENKSEPIPLHHPEMIVPDPNVIETHPEEDQDTPGILQDLQVDAMNIDTENDNSSNIVVDNVESTVGAENIVEDSDIHEVHYACQVGNPRIELGGANAHGCGPECGCIFTNGMYSYEFNGLNSTLDDIVVHYAWRLSLTQALKQYGTAAQESVLKELSQMVDKKVWVAVDRKTIADPWKILPSFIFLKAKFKADGQFDKLKARLVGGGHKQDRTVYETVSSPTCDLSSVFIVAYQAAKENRKVVTADIPGAYLNAPMEREVLMELSPDVTQILVTKYPHLVPYVSNKKLVVRLLKAIYGCIESALLWYTYLSNFLTQQLDFVKNPADPCVLNKCCKHINEGTVTYVQLTVCIYVDDLLITCVDENEIMSLLQELKSKFGDLTTTFGDVHSYIGMLFKFKRDNSGIVEVSMQHYIDELLVDCKTQKTSVTPATDGLFTIDDDSPAIESKDRESFHSITAKLLYLSKRVRPDIAVAVNFLTTRVNCPTIEDKKKQLRVLRYLKGTSGHVIHIGGAGNPILTMYVDAAYAVHKMGQSHSGIMITLGVGPIFIQSIRQKLVSKSICEAELIALSDGMSKLIWIRNLLEGQLAMKSDPTVASDSDVHVQATSVVYEDNTCVIDLIKAGRSTSQRTRHINARYFFSKQYFDEGIARIEHVDTAKQVADILTKPLNGPQFAKLSQLLRCGEVGVQYQS